MIPTYLEMNCRICSITNDLGVFVDLVEQNDGLVKTLTSSGKLYEELLGVEILFSEPAHYPHIICTSCDLQIKLFKDLKERAAKSLQKLKDALKQKEDNKEVQLIERDVGQPKQQQYELLHIPNEDKQDTIFPMENITPNINNAMVNGAKVEESLIEVNPDYIEDFEDKNHLENVNNILIVYDGLAEAIDVEEKLLGTNLKVHNEDNLSKSLIIETKDCPEHVKEQYLEETNVQNVEEKGTKDANETDMRYKNFCKCSECNTVFPTLRDLKEHREVNHPFFHQCSECTKIFRTADGFEAHLKQHLGLPPYSCEQCNKSFKQKVHYLYHIKRHNNERNFKCKECGNRYVSKSDLTIHMRKHSNLRPCTCPIENCGKKFYTGQHLKMHMYHHSGTKSFECEICHRKFVSPSVLRTHVQTIHVAQRFECDICGKKFRRKHHFENHKLTHDEETADPMLLGNMKSLLDDASILMDMNDHDQYANDISYERFIEVNGFREDAYSDEDLFKNSIESCAESEVENDLIMTLP